MNLLDLAKGELVEPVEAGNVAALVLADELLEAAHLVAQADLARRVGLDAAVGLDALPQVQTLLALLQGRLVAEEAQGRAADDGELARAGNVEHGDGELSRGGEVAVLDGEGDVLVPVDLLARLEVLVGRLDGRDEAVVVGPELEADEEVGRGGLLEAVVLERGLVEEVGEGSLREVALERGDADREEAVEVGVSDERELRLERRRRRVRERVHDRDRAQTRRGTVSSESLLVHSGWAECG